MTQKITDAEAAVMKLFWRDAGRALTFTDLRELERTTGWKKGTIQTLMLRLRDKGAIAEVPGHDRHGDVAHYVAAVTEQEYRMSESATLLDRVFDGSAVKMVAALRQGGKLSDTDVAELRAFFHMEGDGHGDAGGGANGDRVGDSKGGHADGGVARDKRDGAGGGANGDRVGDSKGGHADGGVARDKRDGAGGGANGDSVGDNKGGDAHD